MTTVGLVGCGNWGKHILRDLLTLGCETIVADIDASARGRALDRGASAVFAEASDLPACDGYVVAVPIPDLAKVSSSLLTRGRPIFSEKTLCLSLESADRLAALGGDRLLFAMHKWRYHPGIEALRVIGCSGRIGRLEEVRLTRHAWTPDMHGGDVIWTLAVHDITIVRHILGRIPPPSHAWARLEGQLPVSLLAVLDDGVRVTISACGRHCVKVSSVSIHGASGAAALPDAYSPHVLIEDAAGVEKMLVDQTFPLLLELTEFVAHVRGGPPPRCNLAEARETTAALLALRRIAGLGG